MFFGLPVFVEAFIDTELAITMQVSFSRLDTLSDWAIRLSTHEIRLLLAFRLVPPRLNECTVLFVEPQSTLKVFPVRKHARPLLNSLA